MRFTSRLCATLVAAALWPTPSYAAAPFDGQWQVVLTWPPHHEDDDGAKGYVHRFPAEIKDSTIRGIYGTEGQPSDHLLTGTIEPDGAPSGSSTASSASRMSRSTMPGAANPTATRCAPNSNRPAAAVFASEGANATSRLVAHRDEQIGHPSGNLNSTNHLDGFPGNSHCFCRERTPFSAYQRSQMV